MARTAKKAPPLRTVFDELSRRGPHEVLHGDLSVAGLPGLVCTPRSGLGLPAVVFGHGWLQPPRRYIGLLRHLASWGIVAAAPGTQRGAFASHRLFTADLRTALDICANVRLGDGDISVDPDRWRGRPRDGRRLRGGCRGPTIPDQRRHPDPRRDPPVRLRSRHRVTVPGLHTPRGRPAGTGGQRPAADPRLGRPGSAAHLKKANHSASLMDS